MRNCIINAIKATIISLMVAFIITIAILLIIHLFFRAKIDETVSMVNKVSIDLENKNMEKTVIEGGNTIKNYPEYGTKYATIEIPKIDIDLPVYLGDTMEVLKKGVGHSSGSYFPGEGGSIIYMGHNSKKVFRRFGELKIGDEITIKANYGEFKYQIYDTQIVEETETYKLPIQENEEKLMIYTCYPFNNIGYATHRYVVYANLVK